MALFPCPECRKPVEVELVNVMEGYPSIYHGVHCGWGHEFGRYDPTNPPAYDLDEFFARFAPDTSDDDKQLIKTELEDGPS